MNIVENLKYTPDHEWIQVDGNVATVGITDYAQSQLGDIVFVDVQTEGEDLEKGESFGSIEAVKTVEDMYMPISGTILEFNNGLEDTPDAINKDPYTSGWVIKIKLSNASELDSLMDATAYKAHLESL
ncbi:MAG: glycine cleavage system protein GcvH [Bacteroidales bacterium]|nr:glycine cleavage system protein GcvH [Bacteroidales bacterium]